NKEYIKPYEKLVQETINSFDYIYIKFKFDSIKNNKELVGIPTTACASLVPYTNVGRIVLIYRYCENDPSCNKHEEPEYLSEMTFKKPFVSEILDEHGITVTHEYSGGYSVHNGLFYHTYRYDIEFDASSIIDKLINTYDQKSKRLR
ncbi:MAG: hypothetical protein K6E99_04025, partial [Bacilli bacterium]|nr:hypothetical protein [Bacilli bacterium]